MINMKFNLEDAKLIWKEEAFEDGRLEGMIKHIKSLKKVNVDEDKIIQMIIEDYDITEEEVKKYL